MKYQGVRKLLFCSEYLLIFPELILLCHVNLSSDYSGQQCILRGMSASPTLVCKRQGNLSPCLVFIILTLSTSYTCVISLLFWKEF